jgi:glycosyltransferase involved in cell wall biosynthesis
MNSGKHRLLVFVVAYNAERTIGSVLARIPNALQTDFEVEILAIDDASRDRTFEVGTAFGGANSCPFDVKVLVNPINLGYGGNQKLGYHYAIANGFDFVALLHGDGQYAPEALPALLEPLQVGRADAVFGSRMLVAGAARKGGMPLYKFIGNKILTWFENRLLHTRLSEFHSGYRIYSTAALRAIPFERNTNDFHFDTEIIVQLLFAKKRIVELPIPTYYGDEICHVNGLRYAKDVASSVLKARLQSWGILYDAKFDVSEASAGYSRYELKLGYASTHQAAMDMIDSDSRVLDLGCASGALGHRLREKKACHVAAVGSEPLAEAVHLDQFEQRDLSDGLPPALQWDVQYVLLLDVIEHLAEPEAFIGQLRARMSAHPSSRLVISTGNVAFLPLRLMLLMGQFNYGRRGVLDLTHKRLFTFRSMRRLLEQGGFEVLETRGIPAPFPLALGHGWLASTLLWLNGIAIKPLKSVFSYQMLFVARATPLVEQLLGHAHAATGSRSAQPREVADSAAAGVTVADAQDVAS